MCSRRTSSGAASSTKRSLGWASRCSSTHGTGPETWERRSQGGATRLVRCRTSGIAGLTNADDASARADDGYVELRRVLHPEEQERYRRLGRHAAEAVEAAAREAQPGDTELDVAARIADGCMRHDIVPLVNLVASDERIGSYRHPMPTSHTIGGTMLLAVTGRRHGCTHRSLARCRSANPTTICGRGTTPCNGSTRR